MSAFSVSGPRILSHIMLRSADDDTVGLDTGQCRGWQLVREELCDTGIVPPEEGHFRHTRQDRQDTRTDLGSQLLLSYS